MKLISYAGIDNPVITIERPTDLYAVLDWVQTEMIKLSEDAEIEEQGIMFNNCCQFISELMDLTELRGFGNQDDVDSIEY